MKQGRRAVGTRGEIWSGWWGSRGGNSQVSCICEHGCGNAGRSCKEGRHHCSQIQVGSETENAEGSQFGAAGRDYAVCRDRS
eukprot:761927-Hanusia_phi.AAC.2